MQVVVTPEGCLSIVVQYACHVVTQVMEAWSGKRVHPKVWKKKSLICNCVTQRGRGGMMMMMKGGARSRTDWFILTHRIG